MDGYQLVANIRAEEEKNNIDSLRRFPVIVLTADVQMAQRQAYLAYGFDECLLKPVSLGQFKQLLNRWGVIKEESSHIADETPPPEITVTSDGNLPPALDRAMIIAQMGEINAEVAEMLGMFTGLTAPLVDQIVTAQVAGDKHRLKEAAHSLKGAARSAGCPHLGNIASDIQSGVEKGSEITSDQAKAVATEFERVKQAIAELQAEFK
jgi:HPt (histidine-containing phosphotransfer) domain-containing protein